MSTGIRTAPERVQLRVTVADTWTPLVLDAAANDTVAAVKTRALLASRIDASRAGDYEVKLGGARIMDESQTLEAARVVSGMPLIVLSKRRRPVR